MIKIVALIGKAGSGKDTILQQVLQQAPEKFHKIVSCTTRLPREGERNGINYFFVSEKEFKNRIRSGDLLEYSCFNNWFYGVDKSSLSTEKTNICVLSPSSCISILKYKKDIQLIPYYIIASDKTRLIRQLNREENPDIKEIIRRFTADEKDFKYAIYYKSCINEYKKDIKECATSIIIDNDGTIYYETFLNDCKKLLKNTQFS